MSPGLPLAALGGYLTGFLFMSAASPIFTFVGAAGIAAIIAGIGFSLRRAGTAVAAFGLAFAGTVAFFAIRIFPFGPALGAGALVLIAVLVLVGWGAAADPSASAVRRAVSFLLVLAIAVPALAFGAYEAWVLWPEAFDPQRGLEDTYAILRPDELASVEFSAQGWLIATILAFCGLAAVSAIRATGFGTARILATGIALTACSLVTLQLGSWPVGWNLTDYGYFPEDAFYPWGALVKTVEAALFSGAVLTAVFLRPRVSPVPAVEPQETPATA